MESYTLSRYKNNIVRKDLINKFFYKKLYSIPTLEKITFSFWIKNNANIKQLASAVLALKLITKSKCKINQAKKANINLKIKRNDPVGCSSAVVANKLNRSFLILLTQIIAKKNFLDKKALKRNNNTVTMTLDSWNLYDEFDFNYDIFKNLPDLNITVKFKRSNKREELEFLTRAYKLPF